VPLNAQVVIQFNEPVNSQSLSQVTLSAGGTVQVTRNLTNGNQTLILVPIVTLSPGTVYTLTVTGVTDLSGVIAISPPVSTTFTTGTTVDFLVPTVTSITPANGSTNTARTTSILIQFNKPLDPLTITMGTFIVSATTGGIVTGTISVAPDGRSAMFTPQSLLAPLTNYTVQVTSGVADLAGQGVVTFQASFTTGN
jgi:large repetitive protein